MIRNEVNERSPLRILDSSTHGGLREGQLGVVMARAGVGKTAFLVQVGLDHALREKPVLHLGLGQDIDHVQSWYDALFEDLADHSDLADRPQVRSLVRANRIIQTYSDSKLPHERLDDVLKLYGDKVGFAPKVILIDGFAWDEGKVVERAAQIGAFKITAKRLGAELWMTAQTHRDETAAHPSKIVAPCDEYEELIDLAIFLEPEGTHVTVRLLKDHEEPRPAETHLQLDTDTLSLLADDGSPAERAVVKLPPSSFTLLSGGATGTETCFGETAEKYGVAETHFSFEGRETTRKRGVVNLSDDELARGRVSDTYIQAQLHRTFPQTEKFQRLLQSIWHQVATAGEVFVVGELQDDQTVKGGTGWGAELARHFKKRLYVFDQKKTQWFQWNHDADTWDTIDPPRIGKTRFCGTGTRDLTDAGRDAVAALFEASFGSSQA